MESRDILLPLLDGLIQQSEIRRGDGMLCCGRGYFARSGRQFWSS